MHWLLKELKRLGGYYVCPESPDHKLLGPLVGYAGKYKDAGGQERQFVGKVYYNFAKGERNFEFRTACAYLLRTELLSTSIPGVNCVVGMPMGGIILATELGNYLSCDSIFLDPKVIALPTSEKREQKVNVLDRHEVEPGSNVLLVEDVCNNFSTTGAAYATLKDEGCEVVGIACAINRSEQTVFQVDGKVLPVVSLLHIPTPQFRQDDPEVADYIAAGQIVLKPKTKDGWAKLRLAMAENQ
jgi:orotate phosphoribosyltransferase